MVGSEPIIYKPEDGTVLKYNVNNQNENGIVKMIHQTLVGSSFSQLSTKTTITFVKLLAEPDSNEIAFTNGASAFVWAVGSKNQFGHHLESGASTLDLSFPTSVSMYPYYRSV